MKEFKINVILVVLITLIGYGIIWQTTQRNINLIYEGAWSFILLTDTNYSVGYTNNRFNKISVGMSEKEVIEILGEPITRFNPYKNNEKLHFVSLVYSRSPSDTHYKIRQVYLDNGVVAEVVAYFYVD